jgi:hypothetical protein
MEEKFEKASKILLITGQNKQNLSALEGSYPPNLLSLGTPMMTKN